MIIIVSFSFSISADKTSVKCGGGEKVGRCIRTCSRSSIMDQLYFGVDIGGTATKIGAFDQRGALLSK